MKKVTVTGDKINDTHQYEIKTRLNGKEFGNETLYTVDELGNIHNMNGDLLVENFIDWEWFDTWFYQEVFRKLEG